jgi:hypothetical protein
MHVQRWRFSCKLEIVKSEDEGLAQGPVRKIDYLDVKCMKYACM